MQPECFDDIGMEDFYSMVAAARYARKLYQEDIEQAVLNAAMKLLPEK